MSGLAHNFDPFTNMKTAQLPQVGKQIQGGLAHWCRLQSFCQSCNYSCNYSTMTLCKWPVIVKNLSENPNCVIIILSLLKISRALARSSAGWEGHDCCSTDSLGLDFL